MNQSPFVVGPPLSADQPIFGRHDTLQFIDGELLYFRSVNVVGERRMGKTSLINHLLARQDRYLTSAGEDPPLVLAFVDLQANIADAECFYGVALRELAINAVNARVLPETFPAENRVDLDPQAPVSYLQFEWFLRQLHDERRFRPVVVVDEFEWLLQEEAGEGFPYPGFFDGLRSLMTRHLLAFVVTSRLSLVDHFKAHPESLTSTFPVYFQSNELDLLNDEEADALLLQPGDHTLTVKEAATARKWAGGHPCRLQAAGAAWYDAKAQGKSKRWAHTRYKERIAQNCPDRAYLTEEQKAERKRRLTQWAITLVLILVPLLMMAGLFWGERFPVLDLALWSVPLFIGRQAQRIGAGLADVAAWLVGWSVLVVIVLAIIGTARGRDIVAVIKKGLGIS